MIHFSAGGRTRVFLSFLQNTSPPKKLIIRKLLGIRTNALIDRQSGWRLRRKGSGSNILELKLNNYPNYQLSGWKLQKIIISGGDYFMQND